MRWSLVLKIDALPLKTFNLKKMILFTFLFILKVSLNDQDNTINGFSSKTQIKKRYYTLCLLIFELVKNNIFRNWNLKLTF